MNLTFLDGLGKPIGPPAPSTNYLALRVTANGVFRKVSDGWKSVVTIVGEHKNKSEQLVIDLDGSKDLDGNAADLQPRVRTIQYLHAGTSAQGFWAPSATASWRMHEKQVTRLELTGPEIDGHEGFWDLTPPTNPPLRLKIVLKRKV